MFRHIKTESLFLFDSDNRWNTVLLISNPLLIGLILQDLNDRLFYFPKMKHQDGYLTVDSNYFVNFPVVTALQKMF